MPSCQPRIKTEQKHQENEKLDVINVKKMPTIKINDTTIVSDRQKQYLKTYRKEIEQ
jgi:hypothetical protein